MEERGSNKHCEKSEEGFIFGSFKSFCLNNEDEVLKWGSTNTARKDILRRVFALTNDLFDDFIETNWVQEPKSKSEEKAKRLREEGNELYKKKRFNEAIRKYTLSASEAPTTSNSEALALAFANRSAVLYQKNDFKGSLKDIERSLKAGYPKHNEQKLLDRKNKCYSSLESTDHPLKASDEKVSKVGLPNAQYPSLSSYLSVNYTLEQGRHVIAERDISAGEIIGVENSVVAVLNELNVGVLCSNCFKFEESALPSPLNNRDVFCGEKCLEAALESFHRTESSGMSGPLSKAGLTKSEWFLALRAVTQKSLNFFKSEFNAEEYDPKFGFQMKRDEIYESSDYKTLYNLADCRDSSDVSLHIFKAFVVSFFVQLLKRSNYFTKNNNGEDDVRDQLFMAKILDHFMEVCSMNAHEIGQFATYANSPWHEGQPNAVGSSIEPTLVLMNHSCDPNTFRVNVGKLTVAFARRNIRKDEEVTDCYLDTWSTLQNPAEERQSALRRHYHFECRCRPCTENWPPVDSFPKQIGLNQLEDVSGAALMALKRNVTLIQKLGSKVSLEQKSGNYEACLATAIQFLRLCDNLIGESGKPHLFYVMAAKAIMSSLWILYGSKRKLTQK